ncbi:hypothetical protein Neosp_009107 [[Neocosmospora] mangrovei]
MRSTIPFAVLALVNFAAASPCRPKTPTTTAHETLSVSSLATVSTDSSESTASETFSEILSASTTFLSTTFQETSTTQASETLSEPTSTTEESKTSTETTPLPTADQSCDNAGMDYAIYTHEFYNLDPPQFSSFQTDFFHTRTPTFIGTSERIGIPPGTDWNQEFVIYDGSPSQRWQYKAVNHRGFLYAPVTGTYKVTIPNSDEITLVWFGDKAISEWERENADLEQDYPGGTSKSFDIELEADTYTPFRLLWANAQGELNFVAEVQAPGGQIIVNGDGSDNQYLVRHGCDNNTPTYPPFGQDG